jgi:signal transduction histidine kinase
VEADVQLAQPAPTWRAGGALLRSTLVRRVAAILLLALAYYGAAKLAQSVRYTASVSAVWPPAGLGIAALYLWGLRLWPGIFIAELAVNAELLVGDHGLPFWSVVGQQAGNMLEIVVGAILLRRLIGPNAALDRAEQIIGMLVALVTATGISAVCGTASMLAGGVIDWSDAPTFWRTWWLGDTAGGLIALPLILTWARDPRGSFRRMCTWEGGLLILTVVTLSVLSISADEPVTYLVFPALIWAALRFGPPGATLSVTLAAGAAIAFTANELGPFFRQPIDDKALSTQLYIAVAALTTLFVGALVGERQRSATELADAKQREGDRAVAERQRIARDLHDSVSQALFSTVLHTRTAERDLEQEGLDTRGPVARSLRAIAEITAGAQREMRVLLFELHRASGDVEGLVAGLARHASTVGTPEGLTVAVHGPEQRLPLDPATEAQLLAIGREAIANVAKHSAARTAWVRVDARDGAVLMEIGDNGNGFDARLDHPGHYGLQSMQTRAVEAGASLTIRSVPGRGTVVRVQLPHPDGGNGGNGNGA